MLSHSNSTDVIHDSAFTSTNLNPSLLNGTPPTQMLTKAVPQYQSKHKSDKKSERKLFYVPHNYMLQSYNVPHMQQSYNVPHI